MLDAEETGGKTSKEAPPQAVWAGMMRVTMGAVQGEKGWRRAGDAPALEAPWASGSLTGRCTGTGGAVGSWLTDRKRSTGREDRNRGKAVVEEPNLSVKHNDAPRRNWKLII